MLDFPLWKRFWFWALTLVTAAGMRQLTRTEPRAFDPAGLTPDIARSEGWTFGIV